MILKYLLASTTKLRKRLKQEVEYNRDLAQSGSEGVVVKGGIPSFAPVGEHGEGENGDSKGNGIYEVKDAKYREKYALRDNDSGDDYSHDTNDREEREESHTSTTPEPEKRSSSSFSPLERVRARMNQIKNFGLRVTGRRSSERDKVNDTNTASAREAEAELERMRRDEQGEEESRSPRGRAKRPSRYGRDRFGESSEHVLPEQHLRHSTVNSTGRRPVPALDASLRRRAGGGPGGYRSGGSKSPIRADTSRSPRKGNTNSLNDSMASNNSTFAQSVVTELGVQGEDAAAAAAIIDQVSKITVEELAGMDTQTRAQVLRVRHDLKLGPLPTEPVGTHGSTSGSIGGKGSNYNQYRRDDDEDYYNYSDDD